MVSHSAIVDSWQNYCRHMFCVVDAYCMWQTTAKNYRTYLYLSVPKENCTYCHPSSLPRAQHARRLSYLHHTLESDQISWQKTFQTHAWSEGHNFCQIDTNPTDQHCVCFIIDFADILWFVYSFFGEMTFKVTKSQQMASVVTFLCAIAQLCSCWIGRMSPQTHSNRAK